MFSYLDAGTGSMIVAAFAGGAAGIGVLIKMYSQRVLGVFSKKHRQQAEETRARLVGDLPPKDSSSARRRRDRRLNASPRRGSPG